MNWEIRKLIPETTWTYGATVRTVLPDKGMLSSLIIHMNATPVNDARIAIAKWRLMDYISELKVLVNGSKVDQQLNGRMAHWFQWADGGPAITDQVHNYGTSTNRFHTVINFGRYLKDDQFGLDLSRYDSVELRIANDAASTVYSAFGTPEIFGVFLRDAPAGAFKGHVRRELFREWTTVADETKYVKLQEEGQLRRIAFKVDSDLDSNQKSETQLYNVLYNLRLTHRAKELELYDGNLRDLWYLNAFENGKDVIVGAETYHSDNKGFLTGLGQTLYKAGAYISHDGGQSAYAPDITPGEDGDTQSRQCDGDSDQTSLLLAGLALEGVAEWRYDTYGDITRVCNLAQEKPVELEVKTRNSASAADGTIQVYTDRIMVP
jgi:hypothetical protein